MANESFLYRAGRRVGQFPGDALAADQIMKEMVVDTGLRGLRGAQRGVADFASGVMGTPLPPDPTQAPAPYIPAAPHRSPNGAARKSPVPTIDEWAQELDRREAEYMKDPDAFERNRMAADPTSGELRYSIGGGPMKSYNVGANRTDVMGDPDFKRYHDDMVMGQKRTAATGGGGVSTPGGNDDAAYANFRRNLVGDDEFFKERADISRNAMLAQNPFAPEEAAIDRAIRMQDAQTRNTYDRERLRQQAEQDFRSDVLTRQSEVEQYAESERQRMRSSPQYMNADMNAKARMEQQIDNWLATERAKLGVTADSQWNRIG